MLVSEILGSPVQPLIMMEDNQGAISYATNAVINDMTKHIDVKWHFVKDHVEAGTVKVNYIATDLNTADMMTKPLPRPALEKHARFALLVPAMRRIPFVIRVSQLATALSELGVPKHANSAYAVSVAKYMSG
eukprot:jgi/Tetstr1/437012/TSEL_025772.t1